MRNKLHLEAFCIVLALAGFIRAAEGSVESSKQVEIFKDFIATPMRIQNLEARVQWLVVPPEIKSHDTNWINLTNAFKYYKLVWQSPEAFYLREAAASNDLRKTLSERYINQGHPFVGCVAGISWNIVRTNIFYSVAQFSDNGTNPVAISTEMARQSATSLRSLGLHRVPLNDLKWLSETAFVASVNMKTDVTGVLEIASGHVSSVALSLKNGGRFRVCRYEYVNADLGIPSAVVVYGVKGDQETPHMRIDYERIDAAPDNLPDSLFNPKQFVDPR